MPNFAFLPCGVLYNQNMGQLIKRVGSGGVYRDRDPFWSLACIVFGVAGIGMLIIQIPEILQKGGMPFTWNGHDIFLSEAKALLFTIGFSSPFVAVGFFGVLYLLNNKIVINQEGIRGVNCWGITSFRARWDQIQDISEDNDSESSSTVVTASTGKLYIDHGHRCFGQIVRQIKQYENKLSWYHESENAMPEKPLHVVRTERVFSYPFPWRSVLSFVPFLFMGIWFASGVRNSSSLSMAWPMLLILFAIPLIVIVSAVIGVKNAKVIFGVDRLTIINGLGLQTFSAPWDCVTGVFYDSTSSTEGFGTRYWKTYRVEAGDLKGKIRSTLLDFDECLIELRERVPQTTILDIPK
jgi:hypothetical protein